MAIKYWTGSGWVSQDGSATTPPAVGDTGTLGGTLSGITLPQSGSVSFFGLTAQEVGTLTVVGTGPWTIAGTGGFGTTIDDLTVAMGASVTADSTIAVKDVVIQQVPGVTAPAFVNLADGLAPGDTIDFQNQPNLTLTRPAVFDGTNTTEAVSSADGTRGVATVVLAGNVQFSGQPVSDGNGGSKITVAGTQPSIAPPYEILISRGANDIGLVTGESIQIGDTSVSPDGDEKTSVSVTSALNPTTGQPYSARPVDFDPVTVTPNFFGIRITYDPTNPADAYMLQPWTMTFTNGASTLTTSTPSLVGVTLPPFPTDVTMTGNSEDPTFTWSYPTGSIDGVLINLRDDSAITAAGSVDIVFSTRIHGTTGTFTVPTALDGGLTLQVGHQYTLQLTGVVSRDPTLPLSNDNAAAESQSFFDFEPTAGTSASNSGSGSGPVQTPAPAAPADLALASASNGGTASHNITNISLPTIVGAGVVGATVTLLDGSTTIGTGTVSADGTWSITATTALILGPNALTATQTNAAGHTSAASAPLNMFVVQAPVDGISTTDFSSAELSAVLGQEIKLAFLNGTEAVLLTDSTLSVGPDTNEATIQRLYEGLLGRSNDTGGISSWDAQLASGVSKATIAADFLNSPEYVAIHGTQTDAQFIVSLYQGFLGRAPEPAEVASWMGQLAQGTSRAGVALGFADSNEAKLHLAPTTAQVYVPNAAGTLMHDLYETGLGREVELAALSSYKAAFSTYTPSQFAAAIAASPEFAADHDGQSNAAYVTSLYQAGLGRSPDPAGLASWTGQIDSGGATRSDLLLAFATSSEAGAHLTHNLGA